MVQEEALESLSLLRYVPAVVTSSPLLLLATVLPVLLADHISLFHLVGRNLSSPISLYAMFRLVVGLLGLPTLRFHSERCWHLRQLPLVAWLL